MAADAATLVRNSPAPSIDRNWSTWPFSVTPNSSTHAAQIAEAFLADVCHKCDRSSKLNTSAGQCSSETEQDGQASAVVADARPLQPAAGPRDADVGAFRKDRVEMRGDHEVWLACNTWTVAEDVAGLVDPDVREAGLLEGRSSSPAPVPPLGTAARVSRRNGSDRRRTCGSSALTASSVDRTTACVSRSDKSSAAPAVSGALTPAKSASPSAQIVRVII